MINREQIRKKLIEVPKQEFAAPPEDADVVSGWEEAVEKIERIGIEKLRAQYNPEEFFYHNLEHSLGVAKNARRILEIIHEKDPYLVSKEDFKLAYLIGIWHDAVQKGRFTKDGYWQRFSGFDELNREHLDKIEREEGRLIIGNEEASATLFIRELTRYRDASGQPVFPIDSKRFLLKIREAFAATVPKFEPMAILPPNKTRVLQKDGWPVELREKYGAGLRVRQSKLTPESSLIAFAIANADLRGDIGAAYAPERFRKSGNAEFLELQRGAIVKEVRSGIEKISPERRKEIGAKIFDWIKSQVTFGLWQKVLFEESVATNKIINGSEARDAIVAALKKEYCYFDQNILAARDRYERLEKEFGKSVDEGALDDATFTALVKEIGIIPRHL